MSVVAADFAPVRASTWDFAERERLTRRLEEYGRGLARVDIEPVSSDIPFHAEATVHALGGVRTALCINSALRVSRTRAQAADDNASIVLLLNLDATASVSQRGREAVVGMGDAVAVLAHEASRVLASTKCLSILLPLPSLATPTGDVEDATMRVIPNGVGPLPLLVSYLKLVQEKGVLGMPELRHTVIDHIHDLAAGE